jgi:hypothetical protein
MPTARAAQLFDLLGHQRLHHAEAHTDAQRQKTLPRCPDQIAERFNDTRREHNASSLSRRDDLHDRYGFHAVLLSPSRSVNSANSFLDSPPHAANGSGRRQENRHPNFYGTRDNLDDVAARIYLYFPISGGWRMQEAAASAKYLSPVKQQSDWTDKAAQDWQRMQPILAGAGQAASALGVVPGVGSVAASAGPVLSAIAKLQVGAVPQDVKGFDWYVEKVTVPPSQTHGVLQGVVWAIPKEMFAFLGGRLTGSLAVSFIPTAPAGAEQVWEPKPLPLLAHAAVYADSETSWVPAQNQFAALPLHPKAPSS